MSAEDTVDNYCRAGAATVPFPSRGPLQHELTSRVRAAIPSAHTGSRSDLDDHVRSKECRWKHCEARPSVVSCSFMLSEHSHQLGPCRGQRTAMGRQGVLEDWWD